MTLPSADMALAPAIGGGATWYHVWAKPVATLRSSPSARILSRDFVFIELFVSWVKLFARRSYSASNRKKVLLFVTGTLTSCWKLVKFKAGLFVTAAQFGIVRSALCCKTKLVEGVSQEMATLGGRDWIINWGAGVRRPNHSPC